MLYSDRDEHWRFQKFLQIFYNSILGSSGWNHLGILRELSRRGGTPSAEVFIFNASAIKIINIQKHWRDHKGSPALEISGRFGLGFHSIRVTFLLFSSKARTAWIPVQKRWAWKEAAPASCVISKKFKKLLVEKVLKVLSWRTKVSYPA